MESIISTFHLDIQLLVAQFFNFVVVALVLWFIAIKPLIKVMQDRTTKIEKSLQQAKDIESKLGQANLDRQKMLAKTQKEANDLIEQAKVTTETKRKEMVGLAKSEVEKIVTAGKNQIAADRDKMLVELKEELVNLVISVTEKVLTKKASGQINKEVISQALEEINKK